MGILDKLVREYKEAGKTKKSGRGLFVSKYSLILRKIKIKTVEMSYRKFLKSDQDV